MLVHLNKRYWLFAFRRYYPSGGLNDITSSSDDLNELKDYKKYLDYDGYPINQEYDQIEIFDSIMKRRLVLRGRK